MKFSIKSLTSYKLAIIITSISVVGILFMTWYQGLRVANEVDNYSPKLFTLHHYVRTQALSLNNRLLRHQLLNDLQWRTDFFNSLSEIQRHLQTYRREYSSQEAREYLGEIIREFESYRDLVEEMFSEENTELNIEEEATLVSQIQKKGYGIIELSYDLSESRDITLKKLLKRHVHSTHYLTASLFACSILLGAIIIILIRARSEEKERTLISEMKVLQLKYQERENLASLGTMASGIAHEIRNPLTAIKTRLYSVSTQLEEDHITKPHITIIESEINRLERIVKEFLIFARPPKPKLESYSVDRLIADVNNLFESEFEDSDIEFHCNTTVRKNISIDPEQVRQVLINLIRNARESLNGQNGIIDVHADLSEFDNNNLQGEKVVISVEDSGEGIAEDIQEKIFEPFFSTKGAGTGLGLSISGRIMQQNNGSIEFVTGAHIGTQFKLLFPVTDSEA